MVYEKGIQVFTVGNEIRVSPSGYYWLEQGLKWEKNKLSAQERFIERAKEIQHA